MCNCETANAHGSCPHTEWSPATPTEAGYYWFYGFLWGKPMRDEKPRLEQVMVRKVINGIIYTGAGAPYDPREVIGFYVPMFVPNPPKGFSSERP